MGTLIETDLDSLRTLDDFEAAAESCLSPMAYHYLCGGVADEHTVAANRDAFTRLRLLPRVVRDVSHLDTTLSLFGQTLPSPILLAPTGYHKLFHPEGELATVAGANAANCPLIAASFSTVSFPDMSHASSQPLWFQVYMQPDRAITRDIITTALDAGCAALCLTVDVPVNGPRDRELRYGFHLPPGMERKNLSALGPEIAGASHRPYRGNVHNAVRAANVTWRDVEWLRSLSPVPLLLKGALHAADARAALDNGCDGLIISNHGGRSVDTLPATLDVLPYLVEAIGNRAPLLLDGGIRRGTDVFKALALGARAVLIGRPYLYGLAVAGAEGIARVVDILRTELLMTMGLTGVTSLAGITNEYLWPPSIKGAR